MRVGAEHWCKEAQTEQEIHQMLESFQRSPSPEAAQQLAHILLRMNFSLEDPRFQDLFRFIQKSGRRSSIERQLLWKRGLETGDWPRLSVMEVMTLPHEMIPTLPTLHATLRYRYTENPNDAEYLTWDSWLDDFLEGAFEGFSIEHEASDLQEAIWRRGTWFLQGEEQVGVQGTLEEVQDAIEQVMDQAKRLGGRLMGKIEEWPPENEEEGDGYYQVSFTGAFPFVSLPEAYTPWLEPQEGQARDLKLTEITCLALIRDGELEYKESPHPAYYPQDMHFTKWKTDQPEADRTDWLEEDLTVSLPDTRNRIRLRDWAKELS